MEFALLDGTMVLILWICCVHTHKQGDVHFPELCVYVHVYSIYNIGNVGPIFLLNRAL